MADTNTIYLQIMDDFGLPIGIGAALFDDIAALGDTNLTYQFLAGLPPANLSTGKVASLHTASNAARQELTSGGFFIRQPGRINLYLPIYDDSGTYSPEDLSNLGSAVREVRHKLFWNHFTASASNRRPKHTTELEKILSFVREFDCGCASILAAAPDTFAATEGLADFPMLQMIRAMHDHVLGKTYASGETFSFFDQVHTTNASLLNHAYETMGPILEKNPGYGLEACDTLERLEGMQYLTTMPVDEFMYKIISQFRPLEQDETEDEILDADTGGATPDGTDAPFGLKDLVYHKLMKLETGLLQSLFTKMVQRQLDELTRDLVKPAAEDSSGTGPARLANHPRFSPRLRTLPKAIAQRPAEQGSQGSGGNIIPLVFPGNKAQRSPE